MKTLDIKLQIPYENLQSILLDLNSMISKNTPNESLSSYREVIIERNPNMELLTISEVAKRLKVNKNTVYNLIRTGNLTALKLGSLKVTYKELDRFIDYSNGKDFSDLEKVQNFTPWITLKNELC